MVLHKLSQLYKQYPCSILSVFDLYETRYEQDNYFWNYILSIIDPFNLIQLSTLPTLHTLWIGNVEQSQFEI